MYSVVWFMSQRFIGFSKLFFSFFVYEFCPNVNITIYFIYKKNFIEIVIKTCDQLRTQTTQMASLIINFSRLIRLLSKCYPESWYELTDNNIIMTLKINCSGFSTNFIWQLNN